MLGSYFRLNVATFGTRQGHLLWSHDKSTYRLFAMKLEGVPEKVLGQFFIVNNASVV